MRASALRDIVSIFIEDANQSRELADVVRANHLHQSTLLLVQVPVPNVAHLLLNRPEGD